MVPAPMLPSGDSLFPPVESSESGEGVTAAGTSPNPCLVRRLARAKGFLADLRSDRRERHSVQGESLTADQKRIYKCEIAKKKEKIRRLKLLLTGQPKPDDPEVEVKQESLEDHLVERESFP